MPYPPLFSSTLTYANRYDLDQIDVFLEGESSNPMFFTVNGLPNQLSFGKHYFYLSVLNSAGQNYQLKTNSKILFEFKSINNVVLKSDVTTVNQKNGVATCFVEVLRDPLRSMKDIEDGQGALTLVGTLENKPNRGVIIPAKFRDALNYRCSFPIEIRKNLINANSPKITNSTQKTETLKGQFSFAKASISPLKTSELGMVYDNGTGLPKEKIVNTEKGGSLS